MHPSWIAEFEHAESDQKNLFSNHSEHHRRRIYNELGVIGLLIYIRLNQHRQPDDFYGDNLSRGIPNSRTNILAFLCFSMLNYLD